jgi:hypothetical protein
MFTRVLHGSLSRARYIQSTNPVSLRSVLILRAVIDHYIALHYGLDDRGSRVRFSAELGIFLFTTVFRTTLGPTQPPIQWVPGALSLGVKRPGCETDHLPPSRAEVKECVELYLYFPISLRGVVLS